ncbi:MAG: CHAT domain-containing protein [Leptolyngbyaceae bacterium]|nr:CHAT domain-containing protein [Leptolyngbyaceae bacterium]
MDAQRKTVRASQHCLLTLLTLFAIAATPFTQNHFVTPAFAQTSATRQVEADRLLEVGGAQFQSGQLEAAFKSWQQALALYRQLKDPKGERRCLINLGAVLHSTGDYSKAIEYYQQSLAIPWEAKDRSERGQILNNLGLAYRDQRDYDKATDYLQQSLTIARELNQRHVEGQTLGNLGLIQSDLQAYDKAIAYHLQALEIFRAVAAPQSEALTLDHLGSAYGAMGDYSKAIDYHQQSLKLAQTLENPRGVSNALESLGGIYSSLGDYSKALSYHQQSLGIAQKIGDRQGQGEALKNLGGVYFSLREYDKAAESYQQSLVLLQETQDPEGLIDLLTGLGNLYYVRGDNRKAIQYYQASLNISRQIQDRIGEEGALGNLGNAYQALGNYRQAIEYYQQSLAIARQVKDSAGEWKSLNNLGAVLLASGDLAAAEKSLRDGIKLSESLRSRLGSRDAEKVSLFEEQTRTYRTLQKVLIARNQPEAALEIAEQGRARAFIDLLAQRLDANSGIKLGVNPPNIQQIQQIAKTQNATIVEYSIMVENLKEYGSLLGQDSELFIWVVQPTGKVTFRRVDLKSLNSSLEALVASSRDSINVRNRSFDFNENQDRVARAIAQLEARQSKTSRLQELHQILIQPISDLLPTDPQAQVIFVPQGALFLVPFVALQDREGKYLIEKHTIRTAPAIQVLNLTHQQQQKVRQAKLQDVVIVGNPTMPKVPSRLGEDPQQLPELPGAEQEARAIASLLKTQAAIGQQATKSWVLEQMPKSRLIHLATHGLLDDFKGLGVPGVIALAPSGKEDGLLTSSEILGLQLNAELVVLSACDTGRGRITGDGVIGLSRSFIAAGVPSVVVSLWKVPDTPTAALMTAFYQKLQQQPNKAQALRQAMLTTLKIYPEPQDWAAFTLIGEAE